MGGVGQGMCPGAGLAETLGMFIWETHLFFQLVQVLFVSQGAADLVGDIWPGEGDGFSGFGRLSGSCRVQ